jgi:hypothetical protein
VTLKEIRSKDDLPSDTQALKDLLWSLLGEYRRLEDKCLMDDNYTCGVTTITLEG